MLKNVVKNVLASRKNLIKIVAAVVILSAPLQRSYGIGIWFVLVVLVLYLGYNFKHLIHTIRKFSVLDTKNKVRCIIYIATSVIGIDMLLNRKISYFILLVIMAIDYLMCDTEQVGKSRLRS